jgi:hypothetical protein
MYMCRVHAPCRTLSEGTGTGRTSRFAAPTTPREAQGGHRAPPALGGWGAGEDRGTDARLPGLDQGAEQALLRWRK